MPRPFHPKRNLKAQRAYKEQGFRDDVKKARRVPAGQGRPLRVMFADEARFGHGRMLSIGSSVYLRKTKT